MNLTLFAKNGTLRRLVAQLSWLDRLLPLFIVTAIVVGCVISVYAPEARKKFQSDVKLEGVAIPLAVGLIVMMIPPICAVEWEEMHNILRDRRVYSQVVISVVINWLVCPFVMLALSWMALFDEEEYLVGVIMIGIARCIAMVLVWNTLAGGNNTLCAIIVMANSLLQIVLYAPMQIFLCYVISGATRTASVNYGVVAKSVGVFLGIPLGVGLVLRAVGVLALGKTKFQKRVLPYVSPWSLIGLLYTIVVIFIERGDEFVKHIGEAFLCVIPLFVYFLVVWFGTFFVVRYVSHKLYLRQHVAGNRRSGTCSCEKSPLIEEEVRRLSPRWSLWCCANYGDVITQAFTAASNNFELSLSVSISIFGANSKQAIASTFGVLLEVPILLALTVVAKYFRMRFEWSDVEESSDDDESVMSE